ncbi:hypothetical protein C8J57DRAFT_1533258 [Mycena rebaudengoi]|nr:hypothetical protein C8J57DRAFT_1533258 [Mycena rebaudengoi]
MSSQATMHVSQNPGKQIQETRGRKKGSLSDSQKATRAMAALKRKIQKAALNELLDQFHALRNKVIVDMARTHSYEVGYIKRLVMSESAIKTTRSMTIRNAVMHDITAQAHKEGKTLLLPELHQRTDVAMLKARSEEEEARLLADLAAHRVKQRVGLRASNAAAVADTRAVANRMGNELGDLYECTGTRGFFFMRQGHLDDAAMPTCGDSGDAMQFFIEVLKVQPADVVRQLEQWSVNHDAAERKTIPVLRAQITKIITERLHAMVKDTSLKMSYDHLDVDIWEPWKVDIQGWPFDTITSPWKITGIERLRTLRDAWINRTCSWVCMTQEQDEGGEDDEGEGDDDNEGEDDDDEAPRVPARRPAPSTSAPIASATAQATPPSAVPTSAAVTHAAAVITAPSAATFIQYMPSRALTDATNTTPPATASNGGQKKCKAVDVAGVDIAKKPRKERSDNGVPRGPKNMTTATASTSKRSTAASHHCPGSTAGAHAAAAKRPTAGAA